MISQIYYENKFEKLVHLVGFIIRVQGMCYHKGLVSIKKKIGGANCRHNTSVNYTC